MIAFLKGRTKDCLAFARWMVRRWYITVPALCAYGLAQHHLYVNVTPSLPHMLVWLDYGAVPQRGDLVVYRYAGMPWPAFGYVDGVRFFKRVAGLPGDVVTVSDDRIVTVGDTEIGFAKPRTQRGDALEAIPAGTIPEGYFFAQADSPDSFDSRYASSGLVPFNRVIGVARPIF